jgi:DNA-binding response OmpR family regulator
MRVLVVEDFGPLAQSLAQGLREAGYAVDLASDGAEAMSHSTSNGYDVVVLDLMLPKVDGLTVLRHIREKGDPVATLILTARDQVADRVAGLDAGADDYLVKPFAFDELLARVRALVRRRYQVRTGLIRIADLEVNTVARAVTRGGRPVVVSAREYALLEYLAVRHGHVVTRAEIWEHVYDFASEPSSNVIDVYMGYLRRKIDRDGAPKLLHTRRGIGYLLGATV